MNRLTSMCYPQYAPDKNAMITTDDTEENSSTAEKTLGQIRMKPPLVRFRMGDLFGGGGLDKNMMLGFIKSINYTIPDEAVWETGKNFMRPKLNLCTVTYQVVHETVPNYLSQFYGKQVQIGKSDSDATMTGGFGLKPDN